MTTLRFWLDWERAPSLERLPYALLRVAVSGAIAGLPIGFLLILLVAPNQIGAVLHPEWWPLMMAIGSIFGLSFYLTCALPQGYITEIARTWPQRRQRIIRALLGAVGGVAGVLLAANGLRLLPIKVTLLYMERMMLLDAIVGAGLALIIGAWVQKDLREKQLAADAARAQAQALQAQIQPHFFFNTLNTIQALIDTDAAEAKRVIGRLSGMFRYALAAGQTGTASIHEELRFVRDYLEIESVRFGSRLQFTIAEPPRDFAIPTLSLQPLVENAIRHGIARLIQGGSVTVTIDTIDGAHRIQVANDASTPDIGDFPPGHALDNIRQRLRLLYGDRAGLSLQSNGNTVRATLRIPCAS